MLRKDRLGNLSLFQSTNQHPLNRGPIVNVNELHAKAARLEQELKETRDELVRATHDPEVFTAELERERAYAFSGSTEPVEVTLEGCADSLSRFGFCVVDNVIPENEVDAIRDEVVSAQAISARNILAIEDLSEERGLEGQALLEAGRENGLELRPVRGVGLPPKPPNDIIWMPRFARHLANPVTTAIARRVLDDHVRIAQLHPRIIASEDSDATGGGFGLVKFDGRANTRRWHTDWPHDLAGYGGDDPETNAGCVRPPFPDLMMCLVMIWYLTDVDEDSGGTWVVPGSHKDPRNPRGPADGIVVSAPIPGDMQITAPAGSVYIQDSRSWHSSAPHNTSDRARVAVVNRWCPWWVSVDDFASGDRANGCRPLAHEEYRALPAELQPFLRHVCPQERDALQQSVLDRSGAAARHNQEGFRRLEEDPDGIPHANAHIRVSFN